MQVVVEWVHSLLRGIWDGRAYDHVFPEEEYDDDDDGARDTIAASAPVVRKKTRKRPADPEYRPHVDATEKDEECDEYAWPYSFVPFSLNDDGQIHITKQHYRDGEPTYTSHHRISNSLLFCARHRRAVLELLQCARANMSDRALPWPNGDFVELDIRDCRRVHRNTIVIVPPNVHEVHAVGSYVRVLEHDEKSRVHLYTRDCFVEIDRTHYRWARTSTRNVLCAFGMDTYNNNAACFGTGIRKNAELVFDSGDNVKHYARRYVQV